jgi:F0F1-type ATP synthase assembly protein I
MNNTEDKAWWKPGLMMVSKVSALVAIPIVVALFLGKYLDAKYNTAPWAFLSLTFFAFIISLVSIWKSLLSYMKNLEEELREEKEKTNLEK